MAVSRKKAVKKKSKEEDTLFVGITNKDELERSILECSKGILEALKEHERFKTVREGKIDLIRELKTDLKEISKLIDSLKVHLPKVKEAEPEKVDVVKVKEEKPKMVKVEKPKIKSELEKLEDELGEIESKLNNLG